MRKKNLDEAVVRVTETWSRRAIKFILLIIFVAYLGFETSSITAAIASLGVTIGLALQGSLSNIAGGIVLLVTHPYRVGDEIELDGNKGTVEDIKLFYTYIRKSDNTLVVIPNSTAANDEIINYKGLDYALEDPEPFVGVEAHAASSVDIAVKFWVPTDKYYDAKYAMREAVKLAFDANGIEIPYPQLQIHTAADKESKTETKKK